MQPKYEVPVIPYNLRREETIVQIAEALNYLTDVSTDIFKRINERIAQNKTQVNDVSKRIAAASSKLNKLDGAKKATQVFSSSKYPAECTNRQYKSIFTDCNQVLPVKKFEYNYKTSQVREEQLEPLQFYYVKVKQKNESNSITGLGDAPNDIETINDMLLFNTGRNPYSKDAAHDKSNNSQASANRKNEKDDTNVDIGAAPFSMSERMAVQRNIGETYFYSPHLGNVPTIDVPLDLPDLPGIADDLRYHIEQEPNIAPSVTNAVAEPSIIPDLPDVDDVPAVDAEVVRKQAEKVAVPVAEPRVTTIETLTEVDLPTTSTTNEPKNKTTTVPEVRTVNEGQGTKKVESVPEIKEKKSTLSKPPESGNPRASLMDAIRQAGGSKNLKPKSERSEREESKAPAPTGDLMADLHAKLSMRRKGISSNKSDSPSAMDKVSAMIPPPPNTGDTSESNEDDDWDE